jgi:hypothetical protein
MGCFLDKLTVTPEDLPLLKDEHFSVDGTLQLTWPSHYSLVRID